MYCAVIMSLFKNKNMTDFINILLRLGFNLTLYKTINYINLIVVLFLHFI